MNKAIEMNVLKDWGKEDIDSRIKGEFIKNFSKKNHITLKKIAELMGVGPSTLTDWIKLTKITEFDYSLRKKNGQSNKEIIEDIRRHEINIAAKKSQEGKQRDYVENRNRIIPDQFDCNDTTPDTYIEQNKLDIYLSVAISNIRPFVKNPILSNETLNYINQLKDILNRMEMYIERELK